MPRWPKPPEGSWTEHFELGTEPMNYEDSISQEFFELEREAVFKRAWLNVGRIEQLPRTGSYFTKELAVAKTSVVVVKGKDGEVRAFHNMCRHRGNKLVWNDYPKEETSGTTPPVRVQVPRLALRPRRRLLVRPTGAGVLRPGQGRLRPRPRALRHLGGLHLHQPGQGARAVAARLPRADGDQAGELPVRHSRPSATSTAPTSRATGSSTWTPSRSSTTRRSSTRSSHHRIGRVAAAQAGFEAPAYKIDGPHRSGEHRWHPSLESDREHDQAR